MDGRTDWDVGGSHGLVGWRLVAVLIVLLVAITGAVTSVKEGRHDEGIALEQATPTADRSRPTQRVDHQWPPLTQRTDVMLYLAVAPSTILVFDVDEQRTIAEIPVAPALGDHPHLVAYLADRLIVQGRDDRTYAIDRSGRPRELGRSLLFLPSHPDRVLLVSGDSYGDDGMRIRVIDVNGRRIVPSTPVPSGVVPVGGQGDQVLVSSDEGLHWWDPLTGRMRRIGPLNALDTGQTAAAVCDYACNTVDLVDDSGATTITGDESRRMAAAVLSPDEGFLALLEDDELTSTLFIADVATGTVRLVATDLHPATAALPLAWSPNSRFLFFPTMGGHLGVFDRWFGTTHVVDAEAGLADDMAAGPRSATSLPTAPVAAPSTAQQRVDNP